jgi:hypothetical protein
MTPRHCLWTLLSLVFIGWLPPAASGGLHHELTIHLDLTRSVLSGIDRLTLAAGDGLEELHLRLSSRAQIQSVHLDGRAIPYHFDAATEQLRIAPIADWHGHLLEIQYSCRFDDPPPDAPLNTDNPGYGVSGTITRNGVFILGGAHWYPQTAHDRSIDLAVQAPRDFLAVTSGDLIEHRDIGQQTLSRWKCDPVVEPLSLTAGPFIHRVKTLNGISAATYFAVDLDHLAPIYLAASAEYLRLYQDLFGPYAFSQFAVVQNFFPTGYGFPGFTLIGGRVLQLPFIPQTSLGHEIAHCWWGNGVLVDYGQGNWAEGLTTYVAEHLYKERVSAAEASDQRRQWLRNYTSLVPVTADLPLTRFISRVDPVTKTVGYDKAAMVFHMLRRTVGDAVFWRTLREVYGERRFRLTAWSDLQAAFEARSGMALDLFFDQWVTRTGAPTLSIGQIETRRTPEGWTVRGRLHQQEPVYHLRVPLVLSTQSRNTIAQTLPLTERSTDFEFFSKTPPLQLSADPQTDLFRRLASVELPATVNTLRGSQRLTISIAPHTEPRGTAAARILQTALGSSTIEISAEPIDPLSGRALIHIGAPPDLAGWNAAFPALRITAEQFTLEGRAYARDRFSFFGVFQRNGLPVALFLPAADLHTTESVAAKISHYGNFSYLVFDGARNQLKDLWPPEDSPLVVNWPQGLNASEP